MTDQGFRFNAASGAGIVPGIGDAADGLRVLLVGADPLALSGLAAMLADDLVLNVVDQVLVRDGDMTGALRALRLHHPDVALLDMGPEVPGPGALSSLLAEFAAGLPVLALVSGDEGAHAALAFGARGIALREGSPERIAAALHALHEGLLAVDEDLAPVITGRRPGTSAPFAAEPLTSRELEVVQLLAQGLSNKAIAARLGISEHTAKFHVNAILGKLEAQTRTDAVVRAARLGLILL